MWRCMLLVVCLSIVLTNCLISFLVFSFIRQFACFVTERMILKVVERMILKVAPLKEMRVSSRVIAVEIM